MRLQPTSLCAKACLRVIGYHRNRPDAKLGDAKQRDNVCLHLPWLVVKLIEAYIYELR